MGLTTKTLQGLRAGKDWRSRDYKQGIETYVLEAGSSVAISVRAKISAEKTWKDVVR